MPRPSTRMDLLRWIIWGLFIAGTLYLLLAGTAWWVAKHHRQISNVTFADIAIPSYWDRYQTKKGEHLIDQARLLLAQSNSTRAFSVLRMGLARSPKNQEARLLLAQLFEHNNRPDLAKQTLLSGLDYHQYDYTYLSEVFRLLRKHQNNDLLLRLCERLLDDSTSPPSIRQLAALNSAQIHQLRGQLDQAESILNTHLLGPSLHSRLLQSQIEWDRGHHKLALMLLRDLNQNYPASEEIYSQLHHFLIQAHLNDEARRLAILHQIHFPDRPRSHLDQLRLLSETGADQEIILRAAREIIETFHQDIPSLLSLGDYAANTGNSDLANILLEHIKQKHPSKVDIAQLLLVEAFLTAGLYQKAIEASGSLKTGPSDSPVNLKVKGLTALAHYGLGDPISGLSDLKVFMTQPHIPPHALLSIANRLIDMGYRGDAKNILNQTAQRSPQNQPVLTKLLELNIADHDIPVIPQRLRTLLQMRNPSPALLTSALKLLHSDQQLFLPHRTNLIDEIETRRQAPR